MNKINREIKKNSNSILVTEKQKRAKMKAIGLNDLRKLNEEETLDWLKLGLDIPEDLDCFKVKANDIVRMNIEEIKRSIPTISMESALKISKAIIKAEERDLKNFDVDYAKVLRENELQPIEKFFKTSSINQWNFDEIILSAFGDGFENELNGVKKYWVKDEGMQNMKNDYGLSDDDLLIYSSFLKSIKNKTYASKVFGPFISRIPASFTGCKNFVLHFLSVLRKLPSLNEGIYKVKTKHNIDDFKVGETYLFPSFVIGAKQQEEKGKSEDKSNNNSGSDSKEELKVKEKKDEEEGEKGESNDKKFEVILRLSGKTNKGHALKGYYKKRIILEPDTSFRVTKIEKKEASYVVYGEFIEKEGLLLENEVKEYEEKRSETRENSALAVGPKYVVKTPNSLSEIMELKKDYKGMTLKDAIRKANFTNSEWLIKMAEEKKRKLQRILKDFDLSDEDIMAIYVYSLENKEKREDSPYRVLNNALSNRSKETLLPLREYMFYLLMGLRKLPRFRKQEVLYRGLRMSKKELIKTYQEGRTLFWTTFTSTSTDENKALTFAKKVRNEKDKDECGVIFEIHGKFRGYSIGSFSDYPNEEEILLEPDTKFTVMMVCKDEKNLNMMRVALSMKDEEPILKEELDKFESCCEEAIIEEEFLRINDKNEQRVCNFNTQEPYSISPVTQDRGEVESLKDEQQFSFSPIQNRGDVKATEKEQSRSFISNSQDKRDNIFAENEQSRSSISNGQDKREGTVFLSPLRGGTQKIAESEEQLSHPTSVRGGSVTTINNKRELPLPVRGMIKTQEKRVLPLPFRGGVQKKQFP